MSKSKGLRLGISIVAIMMMVFLGAALCCGETAFATTEIKATSVELDQTALNLQVGEFIQLAAEVQPENAHNKNVVWSSNSSIVTVSQNGLVTAVGPGSAVIIVKTADGKKQARCNVKIIQPVTGISLNKTSLVLAAGKTMTLSGTVSPSNASDKKLKWTSSNSAVASVSSSGSIRGLDGGTTVITAASSDGSITATCEVEVYVPVKKVSLSTKSLTLLAGSVGTLTANISPVNATEQEISWSSNKPEVASVDQKGNVVGLDKGVATITAREVNSGLSAICTVTIKPIPVKGVSLNKTEAVIGIGETQQLEATVTPEDAANKAVTWTTNKSSVVKVDSQGVISGIKKGTATITVTTTDGRHTACCTVSVEDLVPATGINIDKTELTLYAGTTGTLIAQLQPASAIDKTVAWSSNNKAVATVAANGVVTAVSAGTATITVTAADGGFTASCVVTVLPRVPVSGVSLNKVSSTLDVGATEALVATVTPVNATNKGFAWSSSNAKVATVDANGVVKALTAGTATITATTLDGGFKADCTITVSPKTYTVTFKDHDGTVLETQTVNHGSGAAAPANPTRTGYTFTKWDTAFNNITSNLVVTAQYTINQYTLTFNSNGGSAVASIKQNYATTITAPAAPTKTGYTFNGWNPALPSTMPANNLTLTAQWTAKIEDKAITSIIIDGITAPVGGANPDLTASVPADAGYSLSGVEWEHIGQPGTLSKNDTFKAGESYVLYAQVQQKPGYIFPEGNGVIVILTGVDSFYQFSISAPDGSTGMRTLEVLFFNIEEAIPTTTTITSIIINGITAPAVGANPDLTASVPADAGYSLSGIEWALIGQPGTLSKNDTFKYGELYIMCAQVQQKPGYIFPENDAILSVVLSGIDSAYNYTISTSASSPEIRMVQVIFAVEGTD